jgi:hypothetical protein
MTRELIGADVIITDISGAIPTVMGRHTILDVPEDRKIVFIDGYTYLQNEEQYENLKNGKVAAIHPQEVTIELVTY